MSLDNHQVCHHLDHQDGDINQTTNPANLATTTETRNDIGPEEHINSRDIEHSSSLIRICGLNVCGLNSKINNGILNEYIKQFNIFCVYETKVAKGIDIANFTVFNIKTKPENFRLPGVHGLSVYISDQLAGLCTQINEPDFDCNSVLWIKVSNHFILGAAYMPVEKAKNVWSPEQYSELSLDIFNIKDTYDLPILLIGDFNGRTGDLNDILLHETNDEPNIDNYNYPYILDTFNYLNIPVKRTNKDTKTNKNGRQLVEMCKLTELCILNGRFGADRNIGKNTFDNKTTIDYGICSPDLFSNIVDFSVDIFDRLLSDKHNPVTITINVDNTKIFKQNTIKTNDITIPMVEKVKWDDSREGDYEKEFDMNKINCLDLNLDNIITNSVTQNGVEEISKKLGNIFLEPAKKVGMCKTFNPSSKFKNKKKNNNPWFNNACKISRKNYWKYRKSLPKTTNAEDTTLKHLGKQHKKLIRQVKRQYDKDYNAKLKQLKTFNQK